ncbi:MAG: adenosylhomocysteine nucleosidase [Verrucomicrobiota bacterium]|jgi:nucleoside phosphorylase
MIAVTFALPVESSAFVRLLRDRKRDDSITRGTMAEKEIAVIHTGVGSQKCAERFGKFLGDNKPEIVISSGFCGGTNDELRPGDLIIVKNFSNSQLAKRAGKLLARAVTGDIFSADQVIDPATDRYQIGRKHGAVAIDMETATIARLCAEFAIPMLGLRAISDSPAAPFPAPPEVLFDIEMQRTRFSRLLSHLARNPRTIVPLAGFSQQIAITKTKLAEGLETVLREF